MKTIDITQGASIVPTGGLPHRPRPFPLEASLGPELASAAQAIRDVVQAPIEMCASALLASVSFAVSAHVDIKMPTGSVSPVTNWFWCVAESGERNSTVSHIAFGPQQQREKELHNSRQVELEKYRVAHEMWEARRQAISQHPEPEEPLDPLILASDFTYAGS
jgi:hypothetical protein